MKLLGGNMSGNLGRQPGIERKPKFNGLLSGSLILLIGICGGFVFGYGYKEALRQRQVENTNTPVSASLPADLNYESVEDVYDSLKKNYDGELTTEQLLDGLKDGLAHASGDPYTEYLNPKDAKEFNDDLNGSFSGIGAELGKDANDNVIIVSPIAGFPAEKAGLRPRDVIIEIDGTSASDLSITEAVSKIRGPVDTKVKLTVARDGQRLEFEITRTQINIPSVESEILPGNIGYLKVSRFSEDTARLSREAAQKFKNAKVQKVILDLRGNPGGLLDASVDLASIWLPEGKTVLEEKRNGKTIKTFAAKGSPILEGVKTVVLINAGSASASEITAGALKDNGAATLIGEKSFGKGSVQQLDELPGGGVLKVTIARWFTPAGKNIDKEGIEPDQKVELTEDDFKNQRDPQKDTAINFLNK